MFNRLKARLRLIMSHTKELSRRVEIENVLLQMSVGNTPLPTKEECRILALKLGTPKEHWRKEWS